MNQRVGMISSAVTLAAVLSFALTMLLGSEEGSYLSSMFIAWGFVPMICSFAARSREDASATGYAAVAFAAVYAVLVMTVYFTQLTVVRQGGLDASAAQLLDYRTFGLFFSYDLLGYSFMALSTFFAAFTLPLKSRSDRLLRLLLQLHGLFAVLCAALPIAGVFSSGMAGGDLMGVLVLEFWCAYFSPVCILSYLHFRSQAE